MARRIDRLTLDTLGDLPGFAQRCLFWQLDSVRRARLDGALAELEEKEAWLSAVLRDWGSCGRVAYVDDEFAGYVLYAPPLYFPGTAALPTAPLSEDAVQLATMYVAPRFRSATGRGHGSGLGRVLVQAMAKDLIKRGEFRAVEAIAQRGAPSSGPEGRAEHACVLPADFLVRVGFKTQRPHPRYPRMRMDLKTTLTWREEVEQALQRLVGVVRPAQAKPSAAGRSERSR